MKLFGALTDTIRKEMPEQNFQKQVLVLVMNFCLIIKYIIFIFCTIRKCPQNHVNSGIREIETKIIAYTPSILIETKFLTIDCFQRANVAKIKSHQFMRINNGLNRHVVIRHCTGRKYKVNILDKVFETSRILIRVEPHAKLTKASNRFLHIHVLFNQKYKMLISGRNKIG